MNPPIEDADESSGVLLTGRFMQKLDRLDLLSRKILSGKLSGERRSKRKGRSVEFADYRPYTPGDDLRLIDWNLYARLDRLFSRLFVAEEDLSLSVVLDISRSMDWGTPNKLLYAKRLCAALGYVGLVHHNRVCLYSFADSLAGRLVNLRGRRLVGRMIEFLRSQEPAPSGDLVAACRALAQVQRQPGVVVVVSDFLDRGEVDDALRYLGGHLYDAYMIHLLSPQEIDPEAGSLTGDLRLVDCEYASSAELSVGPAVLRRYRHALEAYRDHLRRSCFKRGVDYLFSDTSVSVDALVLDALRHRRMLG